MEPANHQGRITNSNFWICLVVSSCFNMFYLSHFRLIWTFISLEQPPYRRLWAHLDHRLREVHLLQHHRGIHGAQGVPRSGVLQPHDGDDVAALGLFDLLALVAVHQNHAAHALLGLAPAQNGWAWNWLKRYKNGLTVEIVSQIDQQSSNSMQRKSPKSISLSLSATAFGYRSPCDPVTKYWHRLHTSVYDLYHLPHPLAGSPWVPDHVTCLHLSRVDAVEGQGADVGIRRHLKGQAR